MICTQYYLPTKVLWFNNSDEFSIQNSLSFSKHGILRETTCPQTLEQNWVAECKNKNILETTRSLLIGAQASRSYWVDAITYVVYLLNRMLSKVLDF